MRANVRHNGVLHEHVIIVSARADNVPHVPRRERISVDDLRHTNDGIVHISARFGFADKPDVPLAVAQAVRTGLCGSGISIQSASYFVSRANLRPKPGSMNRWRKLLFITLAHNAADPASYFNLPVEHTVFMGNDVELVRYVDAMAGPVQVTVLGAGSWGTTVASIAARNTPTLLWAREAERRREINGRHTNSRYFGATGCRRHWRRRRTCARRRLGPTCWSSACPRTRSAAC